MNKQINQIYWSAIEYEYAKQHPQHSDLKGGFVYVFLKTKDEKTFLDVVNRAFIKEKLKIINVEFVNAYDKKMKWDNLKDAEKYKELFTLAKLHDDVVFDDFYAYQQ